MKMNKLTKLITVLLSVALLIGSALCIGASATDAEPSVEITAKNLSYGGKISIAFAVKTANTDNAPELLVYKSEPASTDTAADYTVTEYTEKTVKGESALVFLTPGIAPSNMNTAIYARARVATDGGYAYSELVRYSITEYAYEVQYNADVDEAFSDFGATLITYGTQLAGLLGEADTPAAKKYVAIADGYEGTVDGKYSSGIFASGETINLVFNGTVPEGMENTGMWKNELDSSIVSGENLSATSHGVYSPVFAPKYVAGEYFNGTQEGTREDFADANLNLPITGGTVSDGSLVFSGNGGHAIGNNMSATFEKGTKYVFEADFTYNGGAAKDFDSDNKLAFIGLLNNDSEIKDSNMFAFGYIHLLDEEGSSISLLGATIEKDKKYNIRLEYTVGDGDIGSSFATWGDYVRNNMKFYVNGVEQTLPANDAMGIGANVRSSGSDKTFYGFGIFTRNSSYVESFDITMDNVYVGPVGTLPDNVIESYYETATTGSKYDFSTDDTSMLSIYNAHSSNGGQYGSLTAANGVLTLAGNPRWYGFAFENGDYDSSKTYAAGTKYVFEADIAYLGGSTTKTAAGNNAYLSPSFVGLFPASGTSYTNGQMSSYCYANYADGKTATAGEQSNFQLFGVDFTKGEAAKKLTVVYTVGAKTSVDIFVDLVQVASYTLTSGSNADTNFYGFGFYIRGDSYTTDLSLTFDNVYVGVIEAE